jgi:hypothetical protein
MNNFAVSIVASSLIYTCSIDRRRLRVDGPLAAARLSRRGFFDPSRPWWVSDTYSAQFLRRILSIRYLGRISKGGWGKEHYNVMFRQRGMESRVQPPICQRKDGAKGGYARLGRSAPGGNT